MQPAKDRYSMFREKIIDVAVVVVVGPTSAEEGHRTNDIRRISGLTLGSEKKSAARASERTPHQHDRDNDKYISSTETVSSKYNANDRNILLLIRCVCHASHASTPSPQKKHSS